MTRYLVVHGLNYARDAETANALRDLAIVASDAFHRAKETHDPRDQDAAATAEAARAEAVAQALDDGRLRRAEPGQVVDDLPAGSVEWLLAAGHIEAVIETRAHDVDEPGGLLESAFDLEA